MILPDYPEDASLLRLALEKIANSRECDAEIKKTAVAALTKGCVIFNGDGKGDDTEAIRALVTGSRYVIDGRDYRLLNYAPNYVRVVDRNIRLTDTVVIPAKGPHVAIVSCNILATAPHAFVFERYDRQRHALIFNYIASAQPEPNPVGTNNYYVTLEDSE